MRLIVSTNNNINFTNGKRIFNTVKKVKQMNVKVSERIKVLRTSNKMSQTEFANWVNISRATASAYENGSIQPSYDVLIKIAALFNVSTDFLLGIEDKVNVDISKLDENEQALIMRLVKSFEDKNIQIESLSTSSSKSNKIR